MFHHLAANQKESTLREIRRVLKPEGSLHLVDFAGPEDRADGWLTQLFHSSERLKDNSEARIVALIRGGGFPGREESDGSEYTLSRLASRLLPGICPGIREVVGSIG